MSLKTSTIRYATSAALALTVSVSGGMTAAMANFAAEPAKPKAPPVKDKQPMADNSVCYVCHLNLQEEPLVDIHARNQLGCTGCHGDSWDHADDEENVTPPDIMFPLDKIDAMCQECHQTHHAPARKILARWQERCPSKKDPQSIICTDCHGQHRLKMRVVRWNRKTRELMEEEKTDANGTGH